VPCLQQPTGTGWKSRGLAQGLRPKAVGAARAGAARITRTLSLTPGRRLGSYEILSALGAGGMGEVYRATDTRLGRDVALKLLPEAFASDPERLSRFEREAKVLASLNHPGIAHLYGFESVALAGGTRANVLVMELAEGEDLAERLKRGPLPVDEAVAGRDGRGGHGPPVPAVPAGHERASTGVCTP
jgi:serine/threonine protein kinase